MVANHGFRIRRLSDSHTQLLTIAPRETIEFLENLLPPENNGELDKLIERLEKDLGAKGRPFLVGKSRSARVKFVKDHIKRLEDDL